MSIDPPSFTRAEIRAAEDKMIRLAHDMQAKNAARCAAADAARRSSPPDPQRVIPGEVRVGRTSVWWPVCAAVCAAVLALWAAAAMVMLMGIALRAAL